VEAAVVLQPWARPGRPAQLSAGRIALCQVAALRQPNQGQPSGLRRPREARTGSRRPPAARQAELRQPEASVVHLAASAVLAHLRRAASASV
jgi:hypothetical protein